MNTSETIKVAIEFVSKQIDPGGGGAVTPVAQTGDFAIFAIIALVLVCALAFAMFKVSRVYNNGNAIVGNHVRNKNIYKDWHAAVKASIIIAVCAALIAFLSIATTKAIAANTSNGLVVQPDKIQIPIDETTGQPDTANFKFINDSTDDYLFDTSLMSLTDDAKSLTSPEDWGINIAGGDTTIFTGEPDGETTYTIKNIQTLKPAQSMDSVLTFTKFDVDLAKKLIGKQVFSLTLNYNDQKVAPNPKVNTNLIYNKEEQTGVELLAGYTLEGTTKATNADTYYATARLAEGYDIWEDGTTEPKTIEWTIAKSKISKIIVTGLHDSYKYEAGVQRTFPKSGETPYTLSATMAPGYDDIFDTTEVSLSPTITPIYKTDPGKYMLGLDKTAYVWTYSNPNVEFSDSWEISDAYLLITQEDIPVAPPTAITGLVYDGTRQQGVASSEAYKLDGAFETDAGNYTATATLNPGYIWIGGGTSPITIPWSIAKAESNYSEGNNPKAAENLYYQATNLNLLSNPGQTDCGTIWYSTDDGKSYSQTPPVGKNASEYTVLVKIQGDKNHFNSEPVLLDVNIGKAIVKNMTVQGATVTVAYDAKEYKCPANPTDPFYTVSYVMEEGYSGAGIYPEKVLTNPVMTTPVTRTDVGITYLGIGTTYIPYYEDSTNVQVNNWIIHDGFLKINESQKVNLVVTATLPGTQTAVFLGDKVVYNVSVTNNTEDKISGAKLYINGEEFSGTDLPDIDPGATIELDPPYEYTVGSTDFLYSYLYKFFTFEYGPAQDPYINFVYNATPLDYKKVDKPTVSDNMTYRGSTHPYEPFTNLEGCEVKDGPTSKYEAGTYNTLINLLPGYKWTDGTSTDIIVSWTIKKFALALSFEKANYTIQYGDDWNAAEAKVVYNPTTFPDDVSDIFTKTPIAKTSYNTGADAGSNFDINFDFGSVKNNNYEISSTVSLLTVEKREITLNWANTEVYYDGLDHWPTITTDDAYGSEVIEFNVEAYSDEAHTQKLEHQKDSGTYYDKALIKGNYENKNYKIKNAGQQGSSQYHDFTILPAPTTKTPKAILTRESRVFGERSLVFVYDNTQYAPDPLFIEAVYNVTPTVYDPAGNSQYPSWSGCDPKIVKIDQSFKEFTEFPDTQKTPFTSMDLWFAGMENLKNVEGLENIHSGITSLNATFRETKLDTQIFPDEFFNTVSSTHSMFKNCKSIKELDASNWTYTRFTNTTSMFEGCSSLKHIYCNDVTDWAEKVPVVESSENMFKDCTALYKTEGVQSNDINNAHVSLIESSYAAYFEAKSPLPTHDCLYEYTAEELKVVSDYLADNYTEESTNPVCVKFKKFRDNGILTGDAAGSDNGTPLKNEDGTYKTFAKNHWAIDSQGRIATDENFANDSEDTIQARIIGICEDNDVNGFKIGLTMMTTHALGRSARSKYNEGIATFGWAGSTEGGKCTLQSFLNRDSANATLFPDSLVSAVKPAVKGYQYSYTTGETPGYKCVANKFWAPSMVEMYGECSGDYDGFWPNDNEGSQYKAFESKAISQSNYGSFANIDNYQCGLDFRSASVWSRSLYEGNADRACCVVGVPMIDIGAGGPLFGEVDGYPIGVVSCFCIGSETEPPVPLHENLYEYTPEELKVVSDYLADNYTEDSTDPVCVKFRAFRDNGILTGDKAGTDNGVPIYSDFANKTANENAKNHWAIDSQGRIATDENFANDSEDTIQARIIGICEDKDANGNNIGLTFMTTHALNTTSAYESDGSANYGWSGDGEDSRSSSCTLRTTLANVSLFPEKLRDVVTTAAKGYQFSGELGNSTAFDKFWAPSMFEMYGESSGGYWPDDDNEGSQYKAFLNKVSESNYSPLANIYLYQSGSDRTDFVWSRSLNLGYAYRACGVLGWNGGSPSGTVVDSERGVVSCFCI